LLLLLLVSARVAEWSTGILGTVSVLFIDELREEDTLSTDAIEEVEFERFNWLLFGVLKLFLLSRKLQAGVPVDENLFSYPRLKELGVLGLER